VCVALVIQHAKRMRRIMCLFVACPVLTRFSTLLITGTIFEKKKLLNIKYVFGFLYSVCFSELLS
jgi:hypothetical protein